MHNSALSSIFKALRKKEKLSLEEIAERICSTTEEILAAEEVGKSDFHLLSKLAWAYGYKTSGIINMAEVLTADPSLDPELLIALYIVMEGIKSEKETYGIDI